MSKCVESQTRPQIRTQVIEGFIERAGFDKDSWMVDWVAHREYKKTDTTHPDRYQHLGMRQKC